VRLYKTSQVATKLGISKQTLLRYEKKGILPKPIRNHINAWREYTDEDIKKMKRIIGRGFTIIELVMVIVITAILAMLAIPRFESFYSLKLSGAVKKAMSDIRYVQQMALARNTNTRIIFNTATDTYEAQEENPRGSANWQYLKDPFTKANQVVNYRTDPQYKGVSIANVNFNSGNILQFDWQGTPQSEGQVTFTCRGNTRIIIVEANTGRVRQQ
jgi:prepilin-type N-terminal cleavage/methylation domain-containing protein